MLTPEQKRAVVLYLLGRVLRYQHEDGHDEVEATRRAVADLLREIQEPGHRCFAAWAVEETARRN